MASRKNASQGGVLRFWAVFSLARQIRSTDSLICNGVILPFSTALQIAFIAPSGSTVINKISAPASTAPLPPNTLTRAECAPAPSLGPNERTSTMGGATPGSQTRSEVGVGGAGPALLLAWPCLVRVIAKIQAARLRQNLREKIKNNANNTVS